MPPLPPTESSRAVLFSRRNLVLLAIALLTIAAGYALLIAHAASSAPSLAAAVLVIGYCVLIPLALLL